MCVVCDICCIVFFKMCHGAMCLTGLWGRCSFSSQVLYKDSSAKGTPVIFTPEMERVKRNQMHISSVLTVLECVCAACKHNLSNWRLHSLRCLIILTDEFRTFYIAVNDTPFGEHLIQPSEEPSNSSVWNPNNTQPCWCSVHVICLTSWPLAPVFHRNLRH